jgi:hypothetical protein
LFLHLHFLFSLLSLLTRLPFLLFPLKVNNMRFTIASIVIALASSASVFAAPLPDGGSAYTGVGGQAVGGSKNTNDYAGGVGHGLDVLNLGSKNAGDGGKATSGTAVGGYGYK